MSEQDGDDVIKYLGKHLVALACRQSVGNPTVAHTFFIVGFVVSVADEWFMVTAGHCLADLEKAFRAGGVQAIKLIDYMGTGAIDFTPHFFDYGKEPRCWFDEDNGVDFGFVHLRPYYRRLLEANRVVAMDEIQWKRQPPASDLEVCWMLGIPSQLVDETDVRTTLFRAARIPLDVLTQVPEQFKRDSPSDLSEDDLQIRDSMFYGRIHADFPLPRDASGADDIKGMSGGPILGFSGKGGVGKYWIVAIQSCWYRNTRIVRGCPVPMVAAYIEDWAKQNRPLCISDSAKRAESWGD